MVLDIKPFLIENAGNTCYIDSLLVGLYLNKSILDNTLKNNINNVVGMYLQEYIKHNFLNRIRNGKSVTGDIVETIRVLLINCGWDILFNQSPINDFYNFFSDLLEINKINLLNKDSIRYIQHNLNEDISVKDIVNKWIKHHNFMTNTPALVPIFINRFENDTKNINQVVIQKKICPLLNKSLIGSYEWIFHSAICHKGSNIKNGHYYTLIKINTKWYIFDNKHIPSLREISMSDEKIVENIKRDCVLIMYRFFS